MQGEQPDFEVPEWEKKIAEASAVVEEQEAIAREVAAQRRKSLGKRWLLSVLLVLLAGVGAWNAWVLTRPAELPPLEDQAYALRRSAAAVAGEVDAIVQTEGRWPLPAELEDLLDEDLTYQQSGEGYVVTNTDGELVVTYDGSMPLDLWVIDGGYVLAQGGGA